MSGETRGWPLPVFGLTGSIASGKSTLARALGRLGAEVIDADGLGHRLMWKGRAAYRPVIRAFGPSILGPRGGIDRARLGEVVFRSRRARERLEAILHPAILSAARSRVERMARDRFRIVIFEAALLIESGLGELLDGTIVMLADPHVQLERLVGLRGLAPVEARRRIRAQLPGADKARRARWVIRNSGSLEQLERRAVRLYERLLAHPATRRKLERSPFALPARGCVL